MRRKHLSLSQVVDMFGIRIVVGSVDECYRTLGLVHGLYRPMPGRFKDYIAIPRVNGYQSLHTSLFGPNGTPIEVQIRTEDMHRLAESGIAAHWQYKTGEKEGESQQARAREWLQNVMDLHEGSAEELVESVKVDLFPDKVYVFTPKGDIMRLPRGASCVDFAYAVHTGVGQRCVAAKVDRRLVPLRTVLRNGQTVEIITAKGAQPNPAWASFVVTAKARSAIRQYLKNLKRGEAAELGGRMLNQALEEFELTLKKLPAGRLDEVARSLALRDGQELLEKVGLGERLARLVARRLLPDDDTRPDAVTSQPLTIAGTEGLVVSYARCCFPIPTTRSSPTSRAVAASSSTATAARTSPHSASRKRSGSPRSGRRTSRRSTCSAPASWSTPPTAWASSPKSRPASPASRATSATSMSTPRRVTTPRSCSRSRCATVPTSRG